MNIAVFQGGFDKNLCYLIWCNKTRHAAIIDASVEINPIVELINKEKLILSKILITDIILDITQNKANSLFVL